VVQRFDDPLVGLDEIAESQPIDGRVTSTSIVVEYPVGLGALAREIVALVPAMATYVETEFGIAWTWKARMRLARVEQVPPRLAERRTRLRDGTFAMTLLIPPEETLESVYQANRGFPASFVHEMTELSLAFPSQGQNPVLLDFETEDSQEVHHTRWFRDGLATYVGERVAEELCGRAAGQRLHPRPFSALQSLGELVFEWKDSDYSYSEDVLTRDEDFYRASLGLFLLLELQHGRGVFRKLAERLLDAGVLDQKGLFEAFEGTIGEKPPQFLRRLRLPRVGVRGVELTRAIAKSRVMPFAPGVLILGVCRGSPADRSGLVAGDVLVAVDGQPVSNVDEVERRLMAARELTIELEILRSGQRLKLEVVRADRPRQEDPQWVMLRVSHRCIGTCRSPAIGGESLVVAGRPTRPTPSY
jgi:hypothetical protein